MQMLLKSNREQPTGEATFRGKCILLLRACNFFDVICIRTLDYIFVSSNVHVRSAFVVPQIDGFAFEEETGVDEGNDWRKLTVSAPQPSVDWPSDHFMVVAHIEL